MENIYSVAFLISIVFFIGKFIESRFINKETIPLKILMRDSLLVYFSVLFGNFIMEQLKPVINNISDNNVTPIFVDNPEF